MRLSFVIELYDPCTDAVSAGLWLCVRLLVGIIASEHVTVALGGGMPEPSRRLIFMSSIEFVLLNFISYDNRYLEY